MKHFSLLFTTSSHIGQTIINAANKKNVDFIVVGRRGMNTLQRILIGSTSRYVVEHTSCPVLIIKEDDSSAQQSHDLTKEKKHSIENFEDNETTHEERN